MMTLEQYLLSKLSEECNEVGQMAMKCQHFGINEVYDIQDLTNAQRTHIEIDDMAAVIELLNELGFGYKSCPERKQKKKEKVMKYLKYCIEEGHVDPDAASLMQKYI